MEIKEQLHINAVSGKYSKILEAIHRKDINIAIYQRDTHSLENDLSIAIEKDFAYNASGTPKEIASKLEGYFDENLPQCKALLSDINGVLRQFDTVAGTNSYRLLFSTVNNNMCRKFHTDINDLRLLCTYKGPGTLWVSEDDKSMEGRKKKNSALIIKEENIHQTETGDVIILKGALYPEGNPALHRSPTIEETGKKRICKRLLLRIDTNEFLNFD